MKPTSSLLRLPRLALALLIGVTSFPLASDAKPKDKDKDKDKGRNSSSRHHSQSGRNYSQSSSSYSHSGRNYDRARSHYHSAPRSGFSITLGTGYAGRGYYYGPPGVPYYYERPDVRYYRYHSQVPRAYYGENYYGGRSTSVAVQRVLSRRGYYYGQVDGIIGGGTRRAIARYQSSRGLRVTGTIDRPLLYSLGIG